MLIFHADPRTNMSVSSSCGSCCCAPATARPGERNKWLVDYSSWVAPLMGKGLKNNTVFDVSLKSALENERLPIVVSKYSATPSNTQVQIDLSVGSSDPLGEGLVFHIDPLNAPQKGAASVAGNTLNYQPTLGIQGYDSFYVFAENSVGRSYFEVIVGVNPAGDLPALSFDDAVEVDYATVNADANSRMLSFALKCSPAAKVGDIYRMTIKQSALDCDCVVYDHISCYDIQIVSC